MRKVDTYAVIGGDLRSAYLAGALASDGMRVIAAGLDGADLAPCVTGCTSVQTAIRAADCVILPMPTCAEAGYLNAPFAKARIPLETVSSVVCEGQTIVGGGIPAHFFATLSEKTDAVFDYMKREELAVRNAVPTAEGAVMIAMEELPVTLFGARCLVTGFGRVAKALVRLLAALGAAVTVAARKSTDRAQAEMCGCDTVMLSEHTPLPQADVIFNTVPAMLFDRERLGTLDRETLLIDLASRPGGVDFPAAAELSVKTVWALSLPGRVAPKSAGEIIKKTIRNILQEAE